MLRNREEGKMGSDKRILGLSTRQWIIKIMGLVIGLSVVYQVTQAVGFPIIFTKLFSIYVVACFLFYVIIDLPPMKPLTRGRATIYLFITIFGFSFIYAKAAALLPQFDPQIEIAKINKPPINLGTLAGPEVIAAGKELFETNKCFNCHKASGTGSSTRGPNFDLIQVGLNTPDELKEAILDPRKLVAKGFEDAKSKKAMPTYYNEEINDDEMTALVAFLQSLWTKDEIPMRGKEDMGPLVPWDEDPEIIAIGQQVFEGELYDDLNCAACHGKDGVPLMEGARDLRDPNAESAVNGGKKLKDMTNAEWFKSVSEGVEDTPMMAWIEDYPPKAIWLAIAYAKQFHKKK